MPTTLDLTNNPFASVAGSSAPQATTPPEQPQSFGDKALKWIKDNGATIGGIAAPLAGIALAPETGGLSLGLLAAGGAAAGNVASQAANGQDLLSADSLKSDAGQALYGGLTEGAGQIAGRVLGGVGKGLAGFLGKESDNLALKGLGASNSQLANFAAKHGLVDEAGNASPQSVIKWLGDNKLTGQGLEGVTSRLDDLQGQFSKIVKGSNIPVEPSALRANMMDALNPLLKSTDEADKAIADKILTNFENINKTIGDNPTLEDINNLRHFYDNKTNYKLIQQDPQQFGPPKVIADALRKTVQEAADNAGASTAAGSLKETGKELSKLYDLQQIAEKAQFKGVSRSTPGLTNYMAASALGSVGGIPGAVVGGILPHLIDNPGTLNVLSKGFGTASKLVEAGAGKAASAASSPIGVAAQQAITMGVPNTAADNQATMSENPSLPQGGQSASAMPSNPSIIPGGDNVSGGVAALQAGQPLTQSQYQALLEKDLTTTGGRFSNQITAVYQAGNPTAVQGLGVASGVLGSLNDLYNKAGGAQGPIAGNIENALGKTGLTAQSVKAYNTQKLALGQEIISQVYGSSGTSSDRDQILALIPDINDPQQVADSKMATLRGLIQQRLSSMTGATPSSVSSSLSSPSLNLR